MNHSWFKGLHREVVSGTVAPAAHGKWHSRLTTGAMSQSILEGLGVESVQEEHVAFRVSPRTMQMLGRQNISSPATAVMELVKNAYDADATWVQIRCRGASRRDGFIVIEDNGEGMDRADVVDKFLLISTDNKRKVPKTSKRGRVKVGEKGIGRLAMNRIGDLATITTSRGDGMALQLTVDWARYEDEIGELQQVQHPMRLIPMPEGRSSGTQISITKLRDLWDLDAYSRLYEDLRLFVPPFAADLVDFSIHFDSDEAEELSGAVESPMVAVAEYILRSEMQEDGTIKHELRHRSGEIVTDEQVWDQAFNYKPGTRPACGPLTFLLYFYLDTPGSLREMPVRREDLRAFLDRYRGIRIYRDNVRVKPYGDRGKAEDWLGLNARKVASPGGVRQGGYRVHGSQVVGAIFITRETNPGLQDQTNREGLNENRAYHDLRRFAVHSVQFLERERSRRENRVAQTEQSASPSPGKAVGALLDRIAEDLGTVEADLTRAKAELPAVDTLFRSAATDHVESSVGRIREVLTQLQRTRSIHEDQQSEWQTLLGLATLGIAMATFGHETTRAVNNLLNRVEMIGSALTKLPKEERPGAERNLSVLRDAAEQVEAWGQFALQHVRRDKRRRRDVDLNSTVHHVFDKFGGMLRARSVRAKLELSDRTPLVRAFPMDLEAVLVNLVTNALDAMQHTPLEAREIGVRVHAERDATNLLLEFADSGRGISDVDSARVFDPLYSTKVDREGMPTGTGMGLTIIRHLVSDYGGEVSVVGNGELGGATFAITLPLQKRR